MFTFSISLSVIIDLFQLGYSLPSLRYVEKMAQCLYVLYAKNTDMTAKLLKNSYRVLLGFSGPSGQIWFICNGDFARIPQVLLIPSAKTDNLGIFRLTRGVSTKFVSIS